MSSWLSRIRTDPTPQNPYQTPQAPALSAPVQLTRPRTRDPNAPDYRLQFSKKCIYERRMPGGAYITAHLERLQDGFYDSPTIHEDSIEHVRFIAVTFVFHPKHTHNRFTAATIKLALHDDVEHNGPSTSHGSRLSPEDIKDKARPKFLRFAPHLLYGALSPETLTWNFNLAGSLGVSQTPVSASLSPSGGVKSSYKLYEMMKIQGSVRTLQSWFGHDYDIEDGEMVWTLEENSLQKSGLPREFTFVMLVTKGDAEKVVFDIDIEPDVSAWFGLYPKIWINNLSYRPLHKDLIDLDKDVGQKFEPVVPKRGFNFANLASTFDDFVTMPGTTYSTSDRTDGQGEVSSPSQGPATGQPQQKNQSQGQQQQGQGQQQQKQQQQGQQGQAQQQQSQQGQAQQQQSQAQQHLQRPASASHPQTLNVRVFIEGISGMAHRNAPSPSPTPSHKTYTITSSKRQHSLRRTHSRSGLRQYSDFQDGILGHLVDLNGSKNGHRDSGHRDSGNRNSLPAYQQVTMDRNDNNDKEYN